MKEQILKLAEFIAPSGTERDFQERLLDFVKDAADEVTIDALGNGIARKNGAGPHVVLTAHADETGLMVIHVEETGFLRVLAVGNLTPASLVGRHVQFTNGTVGVVGVEHDVKVQDITVDRLFVDIGASSQADAQSKVFIGLEGVILEPVVELDDNRLAGRALDNRVGCAVAIEAFRQVAAAGKNVSLVFTAQNTVGARGAKAAAFQLNPDFAIVVDAVPAGDMPEGPRMEIKLGQGPAIKIMDQTAIVPLSVKNHLIQSAQRANVQVQYEVWPHGQSDAGSIQRSVDGTLVGGVSYPARYVGGPSTVVDVRDAEAAVRLLVEAIRSYE